MFNNLVANLIKIQHNNVKIPESIIMIGTVRNAGLNICTNRRAKTGVTSAPDML